MSRSIACGLVKAVLATAVLALLGCAMRSTAPSPEVPQDSVPPPAERERDWVALALERLPLLERCQLPVEEDALCGTLEVREDRTAEGGRTIDLEVVVIPANVPEPSADPVFVFEGGPGGAATGRAVGSIFAGPVRRRDIVLVDQRGTGGSNRLDCDLTSSDGEPGRLREMFPPAAVRACAAELEQRADLLKYTSADHADDIEEVRRRLGYGPINIRGGSYGTRAMMVFAQRYPESTRSLFGIGVDTPLKSNMAERGIQAQRALEGVARLCRAEPECADLIGGPDASLDGLVGELLARLEETPIETEVADPSEPDRSLSLRLERDWLAEKLRLNVYYAFTSRALPWAVHRAHAVGDWQPLAQLALMIDRAFRSSLATGVVLTVQCSELMDFDVEEARQRGRATLFGNYRLEQQLQGCSAWPHQRAEPLVVGEPRALEVPTLFLSGAFDAVTPPEYAEEARQLFPNSRHVVLPAAQHGPFDLEGAWECVHAIWGEFLDRGDASDLDVMCVEEIARPPFLVDGPSFDSYLVDTLVPMTQ